MPLDPGIAATLQQLAASGAPAVSAGDAPTARAVLRGIAFGGADGPSGEPAVGAVRSETISGSIPVRVYSPDAPLPVPVPTIVYFHGGGFVIGDLDTSDSLARRLCNDVGAVVVSVDYRLAPEHPFPAAVDDADAAVRWVVAHVSDFGNDPARVAVAGDSAGANLAAVAAQLVTADGIHLAAQLLAYPPTDPGGDYPSTTENAEGYFLTRADMEWFFARYLGMDLDDPRVADLSADPRVAPLRAASLAGLPPAIVATGEFDPLRDEGDAYAAALAAAGVPVEHRQFAGLIHGFWGMGATSQGAEDATVWIETTLKRLLS
ncbi:MAG: alpha/beta hydrolase [Pseudolysinimonas sp.]